jgi:Electron transfer DM13
MKVNKTTLFGVPAALASLLVISGGLKTSNASPQQNRLGTQIVIAQTATLISGSFVAAEAPTTGTAKIVEENGQTYLEIDSAFSTTDQAPDLQVLLDTVEQPPSKYQDSESGRYLNLGGLQNVTGEQRYPIPEFVDTAQFKSVVVWCRMANATIGYASLTGDGSANTN